MQGTPGHPPIAATPASHVPDAPFAPREQRGRLLAWLGAAAGIAVGVQTGHFGHDSLWLVLVALLYPSLSHTACRVLDARRQDSARRGLLLADAALGGVFVALLGFSPVPSLLLLLMLLCGNLLVGGPRSALLGLGAALGGALLATLTGQPERHADTPLAVSLASLLGAGGYFAAIAFLAHRQGLQLGKTRRTLQQERDKAAALAAGLARYLSPQVWESIFSGKRSARLETQRKKLTVFFSDIRGFTELSEELEAEALTDLLNTYLDEMSKIALRYGGTIDKFIGDSVMVFFGDPSTQGARHDALAAVSMAVAMRKHMRVLRQQWLAQGIGRPLEIRMGLNTGYCTVGNFGTELRMDYTIIGREVNLASRLENAAEAGEILISHETYSLVRDAVMCRDKGFISVKGFSRPVQIYQVVDLRSDLGSEGHYLAHEQQGFSMYLDTESLSGTERERVLQTLQQAVEKLRDTLG